MYAKRRVGDIIIRVLLEQSLIRRIIRIKMLVVTVELHQLTFARLRKDSFSRQPELQIDIFAVTWILKALVKTVHIHQVCFVQ